MKNCSKCSIEKDDSEFRAGRNECKTCEKERKKLYYQNNAEKVKERKKLYRQNNAEKEKERKKLYRQNNAEKVKERHKLYRQNNAEKVKESKKLYCQNNAEKVKERKKLYRQNNAEKEKERKKLYRQNNAEKEMLARARRRAKKKGLPFDLTLEDIIIPDFCPVLGIPLKRGEGVMCPNSPSLDRIIPEKGYVKGNVAVISSMANAIKSYATSSEQIIAVGEYLKKSEKELYKNDGSENSGQQSL